MHTSVYQSENLVFVTLLQLIVMIAAARIGNQVLRRLGQPGVIGEILCRGPRSRAVPVPVTSFPHASLFLFGATASTPITIISQIGLVLLMFQIGIDFEFGHMARAKNRNGTVAIAAASVAIPFALGYIVRPDFGASGLRPGYRQADLQPVLWRWNRDHGGADPRTDPAGVRSDAHRDRRRGDLGGGRQRRHRLDDAGGHFRLRLHAFLALGGSACSSAVSPSADGRCVVCAAALSSIGWLRKMPIENGEPAALQSHGRRRLPCLRNGNLHLSIGHFRDLRRLPRRAPVPPQQALSWPAMNREGRCR